MTNETYDHTISGLLKRRNELQSENAVLRERMAIIANEVEAIDLVLDGLGHSSPSEERAVRQERIILFYRNELRDYIIARLKEVPGPVSSRQIAEMICLTENRDGKDRRLLNDVVKRVGKALRQLRSLGYVKSERDRLGNYVWMLAA